MDFGHGLHSPDESPVILREEEIAGEPQLVEGLAKCLNGDLGQRSDSLVEYARILTFQQAQETKLWQWREYDLLSSGICSH